MKPRRWGFLAYLVAFFIGTNLAVVRANALILDFNLFGFNDSLSSNDDTSSTRYAGDIGVGIGLDQNNMYSIGFGLMSVGTIDSFGDTDFNWSTLDYGIRFIMHLNRTKEWGVSLGLHPFAKGTIKNDAVDEEWRGMSYHVSVGYTPLLFHGCNFGLRLNYYSAIYNESSTDGSTFESDDNTRSMVYPSIFLSLRY